MGEQKFNYVDTGNLSSEMTQKLCALAPLIIKDDQSECQAATKDSLGHNASNNDIHKVCHQVGDASLSQSSIPSTLTPKASDDVISKSSKEQLGPATLADRPPNRAVRRPCRV